MTLAPYTAQMFLTASAAFVPLLKHKEKTMSETFQFLHLALHFLESTAPLTILKLQNLYVKTQAQQLNFK